MRFVMSRRGRVAAIALLAVVGVGVGLDQAWRVGERRLRQREVAGYAAARAQVVGFHSDQVEDGFVLIAGDSQAELAEPDALSCGRKLVNAGLSGANAEAYAAFLGQVRFGHRAAASVVTLGTNHLLSKNAPATAGAADAYERDLERVVRALQAVSDRVVVAAVPPVGAVLDRFIDRAGVANLTERQKRLCARLGCTQADPYAVNRGSDFGTARPEATRDGLHLSDYRPAFRALDPLLCR